MKKEFALRCFRLFHIFTLDKPHCNNIKDQTNWTWDFALVRPLFEELFTRVPWLWADKFDHIFSKLLTMAPMSGAKLLTWHEKHEQTNAAEKVTSPATRNARCTKDTFGNKRDYRSDNSLLCSEAVVCTNKSRLLTTKRGCFTTNDCCDFRTTRGDWRCFLYRRCPKDSFGVLRQKTPPWLRSQEWSSFALHQGFTEAVQSFADCGVVMWKLVPRQVCTQRLRQPTRTGRYPALAFTVKIVQKRHCSSLNYVAVVLAQLQGSQPWTEFLNSLTSKTLVPEHMTIWMTI